MTTPNSLFQNATMILFLTALLSACGGEESAASTPAAASGGASPAAPPAAAPAAAAVPLRTRIVGTWNASGRRSLPYIAPGLRSLIEQNPDAVRVTYVFTASNIVERNADHESTSTYVVESETASTLALAITSSHGDVSHSDITFESDGAMVMRSREMQSGFLLVRDGAAQAQ